MRPWVYMPCLRYSFKERAEAAEAAFERAEKADMLLVGNELGNQRFPDCTLFLPIPPSAVGKPLIKRFSVYNEFILQHLWGDKMRLTVSKILNFRFIDGL